MAISWRNHLPTAGEVNHSCFVKDPAPRKSITVQVRKHIFIPEFVDPEHFLRKNTRNSTWKCTIVGVKLPHFLFIMFSSLSWRCTTLHSLQQKSIHPTIPSLLREGLFGYSCMIPPMLTICNHHFGELGQHLHQSPSSRTFHSSVSEGAIRGKG